jgi:hypothetical protein
MLLAIEILYDFSHYMPSSTFPVILYHRDTLKIRENNVYVSPGFEYS